MIETILRVVSPASRMGFWMKSLALVTTYTIFDQVVRGAVSDQILSSPRANVVITFLIGAPFALFVMWIMSRLRGLKEQLHLLACTDPLTGLSNRTCFMERAERLIEKGGASAVLMVDLDHFKSINDTYGHANGDLVLQRTARHLRATTRDTDILGRIGGEEFLVFLPDTSAAQARTIAQEICQAVAVRAKPYTGTTTEDVIVTMSVGGAITQQHETLADVLNRADEAMYDAKNKGRDQVIFDPAGSPPSPPACETERMSA